MYVYIESEKGLWTVGFYSPDDKWHPESDHDSKEKATERVHYLNGGHSEGNPYLLTGEELRRTEEKAKRA
jgi:hypothetical protein